MRITFDPIKRARTLADRGLDFEDAAIVFEGITVEVEDLRKNYGERRIICYGLLSGRLVVVGYTPRSKTRHILSMRKANVKKPVLRRTLKSDLAKVDAHSVRAHEYKELPELTAKALARATVNKGGRPRSANPRKLISIRLPVDVIERWRATGPGWQTRIAERLSKRR